MIFFMKKLVSGAQGQTSVEYVLMLIVVVALMFTVMGMVRNFLVTETGECRPGDKALVCKVQHLFGNHPSYKYFTLPR